MIRIVNISKEYNFVHKYICDFQYPLSYEPILALLIYTDLYVVILKLFNFWGWQNIGGRGNPPLPPVPTANIYIYK